jgi:hypothetical protein
MYSYAEGMSTVSSYSSKHVQLCSRNVQLCCSHAQLCSIYAHCTAMHQSSSATRSLAQLCHSNAHYSAAIHNRVPTMYTVHCTKYSCTLYSFAAAMYSCIPVL